MYIYGTPGSGKTFMMDLFFETVPFEAKWRIHYNDFMIQINNEMHKLKNIPDSVKMVAINLAKQYRVLCLDEFQVTEISNALILKELYENLIEFNVVIIATSNRPPEELYKGGLQRHLFIPFIPFIRQKCNIIDMNTNLDYRYQKSQQKYADQNYYFPNSEENNSLLKAKFHKLNGNTEYEPLTIEVIEGRSITLKQHINFYLYYTYNQICKFHYSPSDFIAICKNVEAIFIQDIPQITMKDRDAASRFITLIDEMYNHNVKLYCSSIVSVEQLNPDLDSKRKKKNPKIDYDFAEHHHVYNEEFALERIKSRIAEMQGQEYFQEQSYIRAKKLRLYTAKD